MDANVKKDWVEALRSGEYKQGTGVLKSTRDPEHPTYCCLGVLVDVAKKHGVKGARLDPGQTHPTISVGEWAGIKAENGYISPKVNGECLVNLNDHGATFAEIADLIEAHL